jgi:hypothetical protein
MYQDVWCSGVELFVAMIVADTLQLGKSGEMEGCRNHKGFDYAG